MIAFEAAPIMTPERAVAYFKGLVPALGTDPRRFGADLRRHSFTLAAAADTEILDRVQSLIAERLETGQAIGTATADINDLLDEAGVGRGGAYSELIFRTNVQDAYNQGQQEELDELRDEFPVWEYMNPDDARSRPEHAARNGNYYPSDVPFTEVRGTDISDTANCRCTLRGIFIDDWRELRAAGARIASGYTDPLKAAAKPKPAPEPRRVAKKKAKMEPIAKPFDPLAGHPFSGLSKPEIIKELATKMAGGGAIKTPRTADFADISVANERSLVPDILDIIKKNSGGFGRPTIAQIYQGVAAAHPQLTLKELQDLLAKLQAAGRVSLGPFTQALSQAPDPQFLLPLDGEFKWYVALKL